MTLDDCSLRDYLDLILVDGAILTDDPFPDCVIACTSKPGQWVSVVLSKCLNGGSVVQPEHRGLCRSAEKLFNCLYTSKSESPTLLALRLRVTEWLNEFIDKERER